MMCLATVYVEKDGHQEAIMREVAWIRCQGGHLQLVTLMRETQLLEATIKSIDLMNNSVILEKTTSNAVHDSVQLKGQSNG